MAELKPSRKHRILVADDDAEIREMFQLVLSCDLPDCRVDVAVNGAEVIEAFRDVHFGTIVMDVRMPVIDGEEAFHRIREMCKEGNTESPSFIFCTGYDPPHSLENVVAENPSHCILRKPVEPDTLVEALKIRTAN